MRTQTFIFLREKLNSMNLLLYMAPIAVVFLLPAALFMEENVVGITLALARDDRKIIWYLLFNSSLAYFVNLTNFLVTKHTSALTLQVCLLSSSLMLMFVLSCYQSFSKFSFYNPVFILKVPNTFHLNDASLEGSMMMHQ